VLAVGLSNYGALLPNSFHAKVGLTPFWPFLMNALRYMTEFFFARSSASPPSR
jgi:hypothetical protein